MVKELDFKVLVLEAEFSLMQVVNNYIVHGIGSIEDCKDVLIAINTSSNEILDMIEWMKAYNEGKEEAEKVKLYGYDMQLWTENINQVSAYLKKINSKISEDLNALIKRMVQDKTLDHLQLIEDFLPRLEEDLLANEADYVQLSSKKEFDLMMQNITCIKWHIDFSKTKGRANQFTLRDQYSAEMIQWIQNHEEGSKILISAHDMYISHALPNNQLISMTGVTMGDNLKKFFKDDYYSIGFDFFRVILWPLILWGNTLFSNLNHPQRGSFLMK